MTRKQWEDQLLTEQQAVSIPIPQKEAFLHRRNSEPFWNRGQTKKELLGNNLANHVHIKRVGCMILRTLSLPWSIDPRATCGCFFASSSEVLHIMQGKINGVKYQDVLEEIFLILLAKTTAQTYTTVQKF